MPWRANWTQEVSVLSQTTIQQTYGPVYVSVSQPTHRWRPATYEYCFVLSYKSQRKSCCVHFPIISVWRVHVMSINCVFPSFAWKEGINLRPFMAICQPATLQCNPEHRAPCVVPDLYYANIHCQTASKLCRWDGSRTVGPLFHLCATWVLRERLCPRVQGQPAAPTSPGRSMQAINELYQRWSFFSFKECLHPPRWPQLSFMNELDWPSGWASGSLELLCTERCNLSALLPPRCSSVCLHVKCFTRLKIKSDGIKSIGLDGSIAEKNPTPPHPPLAGCISW